jgi:hypothetical protein
MDLIQSHEPRKPRGLKTRLLTKAQNTNFHPTKISRFHHHRLIGAESALRFRPRLGKETNLG